MGNRWFNLPRTWIIISILIVVFSMGGNWYMYGNMAKETVKRVEKLEDCAEVHSEFDKRIDINQIESENNYNELRKDNERLQKKMDKLIDLMEEKLDGAILLTQPTDYNNLKKELNN